MTTLYLVTRHLAALKWLEDQTIECGIASDKIMHVAHLDSSRVQAGDTVVGVLPINLAAGVCQRGARYFYLVLDIPAAFRGAELSLQNMLEFNARLVEYRVIELPS